MANKHDQTSRDGGDSKKRKRENDKERNAKRHRQQDQKNTENKGKKQSSNAAELKDNALRVLSDLKNDSAKRDHLNGTQGEQNALATLDSTGWRLGGGLGGRIADIDPVFSRDEKHIILASHTSLSVYSVSDSLLLRRISLPLSEVTKDGEHRLTASIVSVCLSPTDADFVWVACSDGRIWKLNWRLESKPRDALVTKSSTLLDMCVAAIELHKSDVDVLYVSEQRKGEGVIAAYYRIGQSQSSHVLFRTSQPDQTIYLLRSTENGKVVVGASAEGMVVGTVQPGGTKGGAEIEGEFYSFDTADIVCSLDLRFSSRPATSATPKKQGKKPTAEVLDLVVGCARGAMYVYNDIINKLQNLRGSKSKKEDIQARKFHWHRKAVHSIKWSTDGNYMISGGSENTLVLWQVDTGKATHLPHLSGNIENIVVAPSGSSYAVHLDDNSAIIVSTSEMKPTFYISGLQSAARYFTRPKDSLVLRLGNVSQEVRSPIPAALSPANSSKLHVCVGAGQQAVMSGWQQAAPLLQSFDLETFRGGSKQALARTQPTSANTTSQGNPISEPSVTHLAFSHDGKWLATVDDWQPPIRDIESSSADTREQLMQERREIYLKFWAVSENDEPHALISRINAPHATSRPEPVLALAADPTSSRFATLGDDGLIRIWSCRTRQNDGIVSTNEKGQTLQSWSCVLTVGMGSNVGADVMPAAESVSSGHRSGSLGFSEDGSTLFVAFGSRGDGSVYVVDSRSGEVRTTLQNLWRGSIRHLQILSPYVITLSDDLRVYDVVADELQYGVKLKAKGPMGFSQLAVDNKSRVFAMVVPGKDSSDLAVFRPEDPQPLCMESVPHRILSLVSSRGSSGFVAVDDVAQLWTISEVSDQSSISLSRPLEDLHLDNVVVEDDEGALEAAEAMEQEEGASEDEDAHDDGAMDLDDDETHPAVISRQQLSDVFDIAPAFAMPSIEDMFYKVTSLVASKPLAS